MSNSFTWNPDIYDHLLADRGEDVARAYIQKATGNNSVTDSILKFIAERNNPNDDRN